MNGSVHTARNIKGFALEFVPACPVWIGPHFAPTCSLASPFYPIWQHAQPNTSKCRFSNWHGEKTSHHAVEDVLVCISHRYLVYKIIDGERVPFAEYQMGEWDLLNCGEYPESYPDLSARPGYFHSFGITESYIILPVMPYLLDYCALSKWLFRAGDFLWFTWGSGCFFIEESSPKQENKTQSGKQIRFCGKKEKQLFLWCSVTSWWCFCCICHNTCLEQRVLFSLSSTFAFSCLEKCDLSKKGKLVLHGKTITCLLPSFLPFFFSFFRCFLLVFTAPGNLILFVIQFTVKNTLDPSSQISMTGWGQIGRHWPKWLCSTKPPETSWVRWNWTSSSRLIWWDSHHRSI